MKKQLETILNECLKQWRKPRGYELWFDLLSLTIDNTNDSCPYRNQLTLKTESRDMHYNTLSINDLFSKESGLMDFVVRKSRWDFIVWYVQWEEEERWWQDPYYHYMLMSNITADEKINYFISNAIIPWQK